MKSQRKKTVPALPSRRDPDVVALPGLLARPAKVKTKMGRPKVGTHLGGFDEQRGFWRPVLIAIGRNLVKRGAMTASQWAEFSGESGHWLMLLGLAFDPGRFLDSSREPGAAEAREVVCNVIVKYPTAAPLYLGMIREQILQFSQLEQWLLYRCERFDYTAKELVERYRASTGKKCDVPQVVQAMQNIRRRVSGKR